MLINDKVDAVYIPDSPSRIKATDYNQIKNEIQECITEAGLTPTKDVIQLPQALRIMTAQSGAEEVAKIEAAGQEQVQAVNTAGQTQLNAINTAGAQAVQDAQDAANTATAKATEAASSATAAASSATAASGSASTAATQATNASASAELAQKWATQTTAEVVSGQGYGAKYYADQAADSAASIVQDAEAAAASATAAANSASAAAQSAQEAADSAASIDPTKLIPVGALMLGPVAEMSGYILCDGRAVSRTQYSALFAAIGTNFGAGDGSNTFNVPDYRGCFLRMTGGSAGTMYQKQPQGLPNITGEVSLDGNSKTGAFKYKGADGSLLHDGWKYQNTIVSFSAATSNSIYGAANEVRPVNFAVNYFIKY